jgi:hypothetical protein
MWRYMVICNGCFCCTYVVPTGNKKGVKNKSNSLNNSLSG